MAKKFCKIINYRKLLKVTKYVAYSPNIKTFATKELARGRGPESTPGMNSVKGTVPNVLKVQS